MVTKAVTSHRSKTGRRTDGFVESCRWAGLKVTPQRVAIYKALTESMDHPSADILWQRVRENLPNVSLDTVNRTLLTLAEVGVISLVEGSGDVRRYDSDMENHQHFRCIKCRKVFDFHYKPYDDIKVPATLAAKFKILRKTVYLEGICQPCRKKSKR